MPPLRASRPPKRSFTSPRRKSPRGGYTLATGDGVLKDTPFDRIRLLVEISHRHGGY